MKIYERAVSSVGNSTLMLYTVSECVCIEHVKDTPLGQIEQQHMAMSNCHAEMDRIWHT